MIYIVVTAVSLLLSPTLLHRVRTFDIIKWRNVHMNYIYVHCFFFFFFFFLSLWTDPSDIHQPLASELLSSISDLSLGLPQAKLKAFYVAGMSICGVESFFLFKSGPGCSSVYLFHNKMADPNGHGHLQTCQEEYRAQADRLQGSKMGLLRGEKESWKDADKMDIHRTPRRQPPPPTVLVLAKQTRA